MSRDFDARARRAAAGVRGAVASAQLSVVAPGAGAERSRLFAFLRPAWVAVLLVLGSAVGVAMVLDQPAGPPTPVPIVTTTSTTVATTSTTITTTTTTTEHESTSSTAATIAPPAPSTTEAPDTTPPALEITSPKDGAEMEEKTIEFSGVTEPGARVFAGRYEAEVRADGHWNIVLVLREGSNVARFVARDTAGNEAQAAVTVYYVVPTPTTEATIPKEEPPEEPPKEPQAEFSANAVYGSCSESPPFDVYHGTGEPGTIVEVSSEYGSGSVEVGPEGGWELKVFFPDAPPEEQFVVRVTDTLGRERTFEFVYKP